jgi:hypothetical protein
MGMMPPAGACAAFGGGGRPFWVMQNDSIHGVAILGRLGCT